jgi:tRNA pseudouridine55 synthase
MPAPTPSSAPAHGWLIIDKPLGLTSAQVVAQLKRALRQAGWPRGFKIGHGGTLDPLATGVLPIAIGEATKLTGRMLEADKGYAFTVAFGSATATDDVEGAVTATSPHRPTVADIEAVLPQFLGPIDQQPPAYSALKVEGQRAYALARAGETVTLAPRRVTIHALALLDASEDAASFTVSCSKGTYVRALARDLALALGTVGHVSQLRRTKAGAFGLDQAISLDKAVTLCQSHALEQALVPLTAALDDIPVWSVTPDEAARMKTGQPVHRDRAVSGAPDAPGLHLAMAGPVPIALVDVAAVSGALYEVRVVRGLNC